MNWTYRYLSWRYIGRLCDWLIGCIAGNYKAVATLARPIWLYSVILVILLNDELLDILSNSCNVPKTPQNSANYWAVFLECPNACVVVSASRAMLKCTRSIFLLSINGSRLFDRTWGRPISAVWFCTVEMWNICFCMMTAQDAFTQATLGTMVNGELR